MRIKSVFRVGHLLKFLYGALLMYLIVYLGIDLKSLRTADTKETPKQTRLKVTKSVPTKTTARVTLRPLSRRYRPLSRALKSVKTSLFRPNKRLETVFNTLISRNDSLYGGSRYCNNNLEVVSTDIVIMRNVTLDTSRKMSSRTGGESIDQVLNQRENDEAVTVLNGFFKIPCSSLPHFPPKSFDPLYTEWMKGVTAIDQMANQGFKAPDGFTMLIRRGDYANLYWTLIELYNTFITIKLLHKNPNATTVIIMDAHPIGNLDPFWSMLFRKVIRIGNVAHTVKVKELAWTLSGLSSPIVQAMQNIPFVREFKNGFYSALDLPTENQNMTQGTNTSLRITLIIRRNYMAHPRNPSGRVMRKILNENELIAHLNKTFPEHIFKAVQLDSLPLKEQVKLIANTSVLLGVHGAGLAYTLLLRPGTASIELFPSDYARSPNRHFEQFANWGGVKYYSWYSSEKSHNKNEWFTVPLNIAEDMIKKAIRDMLHKTNP